MCMCMCMCTHAFCYIYIYIHIYMKDIVGQWKKYIGNHHNVMSAMDQSVISIKKMNPIG